MRHNVKRSGLRKTRGYYKALRKNLLTSLFKYDSIQTTHSRAKTIKPLAEKLITKVKNSNDREAIRFLKNYIIEEDVSRKILQDSKDRYKDKTSGFVSMYKIGVRGGDAAPVVQIQLAK